MCCGLSVLHIRALYLPGLARFLAQVSPGESKAMHCLSSSGFFEG